jgi:hypothetical protein
LLDDFSFLACEFIHRLKLMLMGVFPPLPHQGGGKEGGEIGLKLIRMGVIDTLAEVFNPL